MKVIVYKYLNRELNLFKLKNGNVVHIQKEDLGKIKTNFPSNIVCYIQGESSLTEKSVCINDIQEYSIKEAISFFNLSEKYFEIREL